MNASELAKTMLEYEEAQGKADALKEKIEVAVMETQSTQKVGNVTATYRKPRKSYQYKAAATTLKDKGEFDSYYSVVAEYTTQPEPRADWRKICKHAGIDEIPFTESAPSVSVKIN